MKKNMTKNDKKQGAEAYLRPQDTSLAVRQFVSLLRSLWSIGLCWELLGAAIVRLS